jgi:hypothetical protein
MVDRRTVPRRLQDVPPPTSAEEIQVYIDEGKPILFPPDWDRALRTIRAEWITSIVDEPTGACRRPVMASNAIIQGELRLSHAIFEFDVWITDSEFEGPVDVAFTRFEHLACFDGSRFCGPARFRAADFNGDLELRNTEFTANSTFDLLVVAKNLEAEGARFADATFDGVQVLGDASFAASVRKRTVFAGPVSWAGAIIKGQADFSGAEFDGVARFDLVDVGQGAIFAATPAAGGAQLTGNTVEFKSDASFIGATVRRHADFTAAQFLGAATFDGLAVEGDLFFGADALGRTALFAADARFPGVHIKGQAVFECTHFAGPALFRQARVEAESLFGTAVFDREAIFEGALFAGPALFNSRKRGSPAEFRAKSDFGAATFCGATQFIGVSFSGEANFEGCCFRSGADYQAARFGAFATFTGATAERDLLFQRAVFEGEASFREAQFRTVHFRTALLPDVPEQEKLQFVGNLDLRGFTYERIYVAWWELLDHLEPFDKQPYGQLERALRLIGKEKSADDVYLSRRKRTLRYRWKNFKKNPGRAVSDLLYWLIARFGVRPYQVAVIPFVLLILGTLVFALPNATVPKKDSGYVARQLTYPEAAAMSVNLFLPVDIPLGTAWRPTDVPVWPRPIPLFRIPLTFAGCGTILRLAGWLFVPLGVAWITGYFQHRPQP